MLVDGEVKGFVQREIGPGVAGLDGMLHAGERGLYLDQSVLVIRDGGHLTCQPFDGNANGCQLPKAGADSKGTITEGTCISSSRSATSLCSASRIGVVEMPKVSASLRMTSVWPWASAA